MAFPVVGLIIVSVLLAIYLRRKFGKEERSEKMKHLKEIPGPWGLPFIGNIHQMGRFPNKQFTEWSKKYGPIYKVKMAQYEVVVVSDPKWAKEILSHDLAYTGKPKFDGFGTFLEDADLGIFQSEGEMWEVHRRFLLRQLRDFGFGKSAMEVLIMDEVNEVIETLKSKQGKPVGEIRSILRLAVVNSLWTIITSKRFKQNDPKLLHLTQQTTKVINDIVEQGSILIFMPWLRHVIPGLSGYNRIRAVIEENKEFFYEQLNEHKATFQEDNLRDFIDVYMSEVKKTTDPESPFYGERAEKHLIATMFDLFLAGSDTTATTISWIILYLCKNPHVQKKFQKEIDEVTGGSRKPSVTDRPDMPYTLAMLEEVLRFSTLVPDGVQHRAMAERDFKGYYIPKDAWIQPNINWIHFNPEIWDRPNEFRPERFLSADGKKFMKSENVQAFQVGKRQCAGETLARDTIFLYATNIFQQFNVAFDPNTPEPSLDAEVGFLRAPLPYKVIMKERQTRS